MYGFDCVEECFGAHSQASASSAEVSCVLLQDAMACYEENRQACDAHSSQDIISVKVNTITSDIQDCAVQCPAITEQLRDSQVIEEPTLVASRGVPTECTVAGRGTVAHCRYT